MTGIPLGLGAYNRTYAQEPQIELLNRFFEKNPTNQVENNALLARPGSKVLVSAGSGQVRVMDHQPGVFGGDLFFVVNDTLFRYDGVSAPFAIGGSIAGSGQPSITFVAGAGYEHLFIADGTLLQYYDGISAASGTLTVSGGNIIATDTVTVDAAFYEFTAGSVDAGSPDGTVGNPYLINLGASDTDALSNLKNALNITGVAGADYSTATQINVNVDGFSSDDTTLVVKARVRGAGGNAIPIAETGANIAWGAATLANGGNEALNGVATPDDVGMVSLTNLAGFVICVVSQSQRFYWIRPGATIIDAFDFATAESEPDEIISAKRIGDSLWLFGQSSTEVWYAVGSTDPTASQFAPQSGLAFSQGVLEGTVVQIRTQVMLVAEDGIVYKVVGGVGRLSNNGIEERIRLAQTVLGG